LENIVSESIYEIPLRKIDGTEASLGDYRGKVVLVVNVASACGLTPQYEGLQKLYEQKKNEGLVIAGFPANEFGAQEPGSNADIADFCTTKFKVTFPMFEKIVVKGKGIHPLYRRLVEAQPLASEKPPGDLRQKLASHGIRQENPADVMWNFEKFLVGRNGEIVGRFAPDTTPDDPLLKDAVERELKA
jgi:glutathione peroxidase